MNGKLYIKKFIRDDGETLSFDAEEVYLSEDNTLLVRSDPATTAVDFTEADGGEMIRQRGAVYHQTVKGLIVPKTSDYWSLCTRLSRFFVFNHTYKIAYVKVNGSMFATNGAWISSGLQIVPVPHENYSYWNIEFAIGNIYWAQYAENSEGEQIYSNSITLPLITASMGGELWATDEVQTLSGEGGTFQIEGTSISATNTDVRLKGDTSQQTYTGKNLSPYPYYSGDSYVGKGITFAAASDGSITINGTNDGTGNSAYYIYNNTSSPLQLEAGTYYFIPPSNTNVNYVMYDGTSYYNFNSSNNYSWTFPSTKSIRQFYIQVPKNNTTVFNDLKVYPMLTTLPNQTESDYEPYVGGIASPNPDYPQDVQVVTGEQTIEVSDGNGQDQSYTVDLGSIELCKIDDHQDYIYKSGSDWYIHKEVGKIAMSTIDDWGGSNGNFFRTGFAGDYNFEISRMLTNISTFSSTTWGSGKFGITSSGNLWISTGDTTLTGDSLPTWLENKNAILYGILATPANTKITDAALVSQLNALASARAYSGTTIYSTSGTPLPVIFRIEMSQSVGEGEVWDNVGGVWEAGSGGVQTISVDSTQKIYPVWTVTGPCVNPVLQNNTTDTVASFDGTVAAGQTLTVYFEDGIAYLDSAIATRYVSGYVSFLPGENMVGFNSDGGSAETSTISWDNIIN